MPQCTQKPEEEHSDFPTDSSPKSRCIRTLIMHAPLMPPRHSPPDAPVIMVRPAQAIHVGYQACVAIRVSALDATVEIKIAQN
jgi:hypothetical protein